MSLADERDFYLAQRRALGFDLKTVEYLLGSFTDWLSQQDKTETFTVEDAVIWARDRPEGAPIWWSQRLTAVRPFAAWLNARGKDIPVIPARILPGGTTRRTPFIYTQDNLDDLLGACPTVFTNARVALTMRMIIAFLAATGVRIGEALNLTVPDFDTDTNVVLVRGRKTQLDRLVPLHDTLTHALTDYLASPERMHTTPSADGPIFVNRSGTGFSTATIEGHFRKLTQAIDLRVAGQLTPRLHDFRHTFATRHMIAAYHSGNPPQVIALLATWLGHTHIEHTYWYIEAVPELLAAAARSLEPTTGQGEAS